MKDEGTELWNLKDEAITYCLIDCKVLYNVITLFNHLVFKQFKVNVKRFATLPSLAFGIFRARYLKGHIPIILGDIFRFVQQSYTGGAVDVYIPNALKGYKDEVVNCLKKYEYISEFSVKDRIEGTKIYGYDVNSLYPTMMRNMIMPVGDPVHFKVAPPLPSIMQKGGGAYFFKLYSPSPPSA